MQLRYTTHLSCSQVPNFSPVRLSIFCLPKYWHVLRAAEEPSFQTPKDSQHYKHAAAVLSIFFLYLYLSFCLDPQTQADNPSGLSGEMNQQTLCGHPISSLWKYGKGCDTFMV